MNSLGILYTMKASATPRMNSKVTAELHVNYWKVPKQGGSYHRFLDFGVMINQVAHEIDSISFYFPCQIHGGDITDLGGKLKDSSLLCTLFNMDMQVQNISSSPSYSMVTPKGTSDRHSFWLYELGPTNFQVSSVKSGGTLLSIIIKSQPKSANQINRASTDTINRNLYFRFRVKNIPVNSIFSEEQISNDFLQSAFSRTEMMDLRINEIREMDKKVFEDITEGRNFLTFSKFHFFFIGSSEDEKIEGNTLYNDCRLIDTNRWKAYMNEFANESKKCIAYHWKRVQDSPDKPIIKCNVFLRTIYSSLNWKKVFKYCGVIVILNIIACLIFEPLKYLFLLMIKLI